MCRLVATRARLSIVVKLVTFTTSLSCLFWIWLSVPVQLIAWKDLSLKWPIMYRVEHNIKDQELNYRLSDGKFDEQAITLLGRFLWVDLIKPASMSVRPSSKHFTDSNEIWCVCRGWWVMQASVPCGPMQDEGQGHVALEVRNSSIFKISPPPFSMGTGK